MLEDYANYSLQEKNQLQDVRRRIMAGWATYTEISSNATLPYAWRYRCTTPGCCQLWHMVQTPITHLASAEQTCGRTDHKGKKYGQHQTQEPTSGTERHNQHCQESFCIVTETMFLICFFSPWLLYASVCRPLPPSLTTQAICSSRPLCFHVSWYCPSIWCGPASESISRYILL